MAIQSDETLVTKGDLKTLYTDKILPYLGGNMMMQTGVSDYYSTDEKVVGVWTDGKPVYQKTITGTVVGNFDTGITNGSNAFIVSGYMIEARSDEPALPLNFYYDNTVHSLCDIKADASYIWMITAGINIRRFAITIQYTKTTDTASSALTTPGCYDINRPDLWPNGQEIFFGNGLYGMRKAGTVAANSLQSGILLVSNVSKTACCYNKGGMIDMSGTNGTNWYDINGGWDNKGAQRQFNPLITNTSQTFRFYCQDNQNYTTQNIQYNIWFTYTK